MVLVAAGFPCQDTSKVRGKDRPGLRGKKSSLVFAIIALIQQIRKLAAALPSNPDVHVLLENVMGIARQITLEIAAIAQINHPICLVAKEMSWATRKRVFWLSWTLLPVDEEVMHQGAGDDWPQANQRCPLGTTRVSA